MGVNQSSAEPLCKAFVYGNLSPGTPGEGQVLLSRLKRSLGASGRSSQGVEPWHPEVRCPRLAGPYPQGAHLSQPLWAAPSQTAWGSADGPQTVPKTWVSCHLCRVGGMSWLFGPRSFTEPHAAGAERAVSGGSGFNFSRTASVILSLWRCQTGGHQAPPAGKGRRACFFPGSGSPGSLGFSAGGRDLSQGVGVCKRNRDETEMLVEAVLCDLGQVASPLWACFISSPAGVS